MIVFRLSKSAYANDLSGKGAERAGGRWNSKGIPMLYTCESRALCTTEIAVHTPLGIIPVDYNLIAIEIPEQTNLLELQNNKLPSDWISFPHPDSTQKIGDQFILEGLFLTMKVPSAVVPGDFNFLINPTHPDINKLKIHSITPFTFDKRLFIK